LPLVNYFTFVKLVALPAAAWGLALLLGLKGLYFQSVLVLAALPTASSAYILAVRMGGDGRTVATIITVNVFVAMVTLPLWLGLAL
jgi:predicted permease